jgi:predicted membrane chloride channel (bestrophin family)
LTSLQLILSGLHEIANKTSDPYGDDESDLNVDAFLNTAFRESRGYAGQTLVKHWSNTGHTLVKHWSNTDQMHSSPAVVKN